LFLDLIQLPRHSNLPKYKQIIAGIEHSIRNGELKQGDQLPSLNSIKQRFQLSRDTVLMAFNDLKSRGIIHSVVGKGYFVKSENTDLKYSIFLLFDEFNAFKEDLYNGFISGLGDQAQVDLYFHHFNLKMFRSLISENNGAYSHYIIMPANLREAAQIISQLPEEQVYILDQTNEELQAFSSIHQNFEYNMFSGLEVLKGQVLQYKRLNLLFSSKKQPRGLKNGFEQFCKSEGLAHEVSDFTGGVLRRGTLYVSLDDDHLIALIKQMKQQKMILAKDIGILCYNDTPLKEIVEGGISSIGVDFKEMGKRLSQMLLNGERLKIECPLQLTDRNSL
jgi:DNA-binding transcriptional regulator YhcF (GntR family)